MNPTTRNEEHMTSNLPEPATESLGAAIIELDRLESPFDAAEPQNGPQGDETGPGDAREAQAVNEAHSTPKETGTGHPSPEGGAPDASGADPGPQSHAEAPGRENARDDGSEPGSVALVPAVTASGGFGGGNPDAKVAEA